MNDEVKKIKEDIESFLMESDEHQNKSIKYILKNTKTNEFRIFASDDNESAIEFTPYSKDYENGYVYVPEWDYNFDYYIYNLLEENYKIEYMSDDVHNGIWISISELYPNDIDYKDGVQTYLKYCKDNNITQEYLNQKFDNKVQDIMKYYEGLDVGQTIEYRGYVIEIEDYNDDNDMENIVQIYKDKQSYLDGDSIEMTSLGSIGLESNVKNYIDDKYFSNNIDLESEKSYFTFVLGYDLLNDMLSKSSTPENDISYDFCNMVASEFLESEEYRNEKYSSYEMLESWLDKNREKVIKSYKEFIGEDSNKIKTRQLDNVNVIDVGYRNSQPIALVKRNDEYVIAFSYRIKDNLMDWAYGYYYNDNIKKAKEDFKKVLSGGNLAHTFDKKDERSR